VAFVPAIIAPPLSPEPACHGPGRAAVELQIDGALVKIAHDADAHVITAVIEALRASR
jgi:transposase